MVIRIHRLPIDQSIRDSAPKGSHLSTMEHGWALEVGGKVASVGPHGGLFGAAGKARAHYLKTMSPPGETPKFKTVS